VRRGLSVSVLDAKLQAPASAGRRGSWSPSSPIPPPGGTGTSALRPLRSLSRQAKSVGKPSSSSATCVSELVSE